VKLLILSDIHLEFGVDYRAPRDGYDVVILAGDITSPGDKAVRWARRASTFGGRPVVVVPGNHEYYGHTMEPAMSAMKAASSGSNVHVLDGHEVTVDGVRFLGATLWTDFALAIGTKVATHSRIRRSMDTARLKLNDYRVIRTRRSRAGESQDPVAPEPGDADGADTSSTDRPSRLLEPEDTLALHLAQREWLASKLAEPTEGKTVVVTHMAPHRGSLAPEYEGDWLSGGFVSELPKVFFEVPALWVHGHVHNSFDYCVESCRVLCNPRGYPMGRTYEGPRFENPSFDPALIVEI
jgi:Icc-related predicted phosphoesterase